MAHLITHLSPATIRFMRYAAVGISTLAFDLVLLYVLTEYVGIPYYIGTPLAFLVAVSINYLISRRLVFKGTARNHTTGYTYFIIIALVGATATTTGVAFLVQYGHLYYLLARVLVAGFVGVGNYLANLFFNFKVVGHHP